MQRRIDFIDRLGTAGALLFIVSLYTSPVDWIPATAVLRPAQTAAAAMMAAVVARRVFRGEPLRLAGGMGASLLALYALIFLSPLWSIDAEHSAGFALETVKQLLGVVGLAGTLRTPREVRRAMLVAVLASMVPAWGTLDRYNNGIDLVEGYRGAWIGLLANPNQLAMVMAMTVPWTLHMRASTGGWKRTAVTVALGLQVATVVATHSRGGTLGLAAAMLATALLARQRARALGLVAVAAAAVVAFAPSSFWARSESIGSYTQDASALGRLRAWEMGMTALADRPLLGVGASNYPRAWNLYGARNPGETAYTAHNMWLQMAVEMGLLGVAVFGCMLLLAVRGLWRERNGASGGEARALLASMAAIGVAGMTGGYAYNWFFYMVLGLAAAVIAAARARRRAEAAHALQLAAA